MSADKGAVAELLAALSYGERLAQQRADASVALAPDARARSQQERVAGREAENLSLLEARLGELSGPGLQERFRPFFDAFFEATHPRDWVEAQAFHYVGDALVADFAEVLLPALDPVTAQVVRTSLCERDEQDAFALDQVTAALADDDGARERVAAYVRRVAGEALTQTRRALDASDAVGALLGGEEGEKRVLLDLLDRHRRRLDRLGIEPVDHEPDDPDE